MDFEESMWRALASAMSHVERRGCAFHFVQAIWRHIQELGLQAPYQNDDGTHKLLRKLMALCLLPQQHIPAIFARLKRDATTDALKRLTDYIQRIWIDSNIWPPAAWSVYRLSVRTNNDLEGWHNRLNSRGRSQMPLYLLVALLHEEASMVPIQIRLVSENKLRRHQRLKYRNMQAKIFRYWDSYEDGSMSALHLLGACALLYGPQV